MITDSLNQPIADLADKHHSVIYLPPAVTFQKPFLIRLHNMRNKRGTPTEIHTRHQRILHQIIQVHNITITRNVRTDEQTPTPPPSSRRRPAARRPSAARRKSSTQHLATTTEAGNIKHTRPNPNSRGEKRMRTIDLFAGCGGFSLGFRQAGFPPIWASETDPAAAETYYINFGIRPAGDITTINKFPTADIAIAGLPCQGFSTIGLQKKTDPRNQLYKHLIRAIKKSEAKIAVIENVPPFLKSDQANNLIRWMQKEGFLIAAGIIACEQYGIPQRRRRAFIIGNKQHPPTFPQPSNKTATLRSALQNIPQYAPPGNPKKRSNNGVPGPYHIKELHRTIRPTQKSLARYQHIPPGGNRENIPEEMLPPCWAAKPAGAKDVMGRLEWNKPSNTIRTAFYKPETGRHLHPSQPRPITHWEAARLQTFPDDFLWCGTKPSVASQIGNAVPPSIAHIIAKTLK